MAFAHSSNKRHHHQKTLRRANKDQAQTKQQRHSAGKHATNAAAVPDADVGEWKERRRGPNDLVDARKKVGEIVDRDKLTASDTTHVSPQYHPSVPLSLSVWVIRWVQQGKYLGYAIRQGDPVSVEPGGVQLEMDEPAEAL